MKKLMLISVTALLMVGCKPSAPSGPEVWKCDFKGSYKGKEAEVPFSWKVTWTNTTGDNWTIAGASSEEGAKSSTTGTCDSKTCKITETYTAGEEKGKVYYWTGHYEDAETKKDTVYVTTFKGTFGMSDADRTSGGEWHAKANCSK